MITLHVNGKSHALDVEPEMPLLWVLRDVLGLTGTKYGCGIKECGSCTVHVDGAAVRSCSMHVSEVAGREVTTIEALSKNGGHPVQKAWVDHQVPQCGYCQPGFIMAVAALLRENSNPTDAEIDRELTNICRCGTYARMRPAIHAAARAMKA
jgi:isoquinoline 1-oxidoreductase alpha subunit